MLLLDEKTFSGSFKSHSTEVTCKLYLYVHNTQFMQSAGDLDIQYVCQEHGTLGEFGRGGVVGRVGEFGRGGVVGRVGEFGRGGVGGRVGEVVLLVELESLVLVVELVRWCWW